MKLPQILGIAIIGLRYQKINNYLICKQTRKDLENTYLD